MEFGFREERSKVFGFQIRWLARARSFKTDFGLPLSNLTCFFFSVHSGPNLHGRPTDLNDRMEPKIQTIRETWTDTERCGNGVEQLNRCVFLQLITPKSQDIILPTTPESLNPQSVHPAVSQMAWPETPHQNPQAGTKTIGAKYEW